MTASVPPDSSSGPICRECGAQQIALVDEPCWHCGARLREPSKAREVSHSVMPGGGASISVVITVFSVLIVIGLLLTVTGLGVLLTIALMPILWARWTLSKLEPVERRTVRMAASGTTAIAAVATGSIAFFAASWGGYHVGYGVAQDAGVSMEKRMGWGALSAVFTGSIAGIAVAVVVFRKLLSKSQGDSRRE